MPIVEFVDTSVMVNLLDVPHMNAERSRLLGEESEKRQEGAQFILPVTTVVETGNHIAQIANGDARRKCAQRFSDLLRMVSERRAPWFLHEVGWDGQFLLSLAAGASTGVTLIEHASHGVGCGDISILAERDRYLAGVSKGVIARVWSLDEGLAAWS